MSFNYCLCPDLEPKDLSNNSVTSGPLRVETVGNLNSVSVNDSRIVNVFRDISRHIIQFLLL